MGRTRLKAIVLPSVVASVFASTSPSSDPTCSLDGSCQQDLAGRSSSPPTLDQTCRWAIEDGASEGDLHKARRAALQVYRDSDGSSVARGNCSAIWKEVVDELLLQPSYLSLVKSVHRAQGNRRYLPRADKCWQSASEAPEEWRRCCANAVGDRGLQSCFSSSSSFGSQSFESCCSFSQESHSYLVIPAIMEVQVMLHLANKRLLHIEQDGWLRSFDTSTVLWPAGYLMSQWIADQKQCNDLKDKKILELGAGVGAASIAAATCGAKVLSTDQAARSLALIQANAGLNSEDLDTEVFDWRDDAHLQEIKRQGPFHMIMGAALRFEEWWPRLWHILKVLTQDSPKTQLVFAHTTDSFILPGKDVQLSFKLTERISGNAYGMGRSDRGAAHADSDFELFLLRSTAA